MPDAMRMMVKWQRIVDQLFCRSFAERKRVSQTAENHRYIIHVPFAGMNLPKQIDRPYF